MARAAPGDFFRGLAYPARGFAILRRYPGLARYWLLPILITFSALFGGAVLAFRYADDLLRLVWTRPAGAGVGSWLLVALYWLAEAFTLIASVALLALTCVVLSTLIAAPFNDALSEAIEQREAGRTPPSFSLARLLRDLTRTVRLEALKLTVYGAVMVPLFLLSWLVPGVGQVLYAVFGALFTWTYFAFDYLDWPASRRGLGIRARLRLLRARPLLMLGFGLGVSVCLFVPLLNLFFMPLAVAGGTRLFLDLEAGAPPST